MVDVENVYEEVVHCFDKGEIVVNKKSRHINKYKTNSMLLKNVRMEISKLVKNVAKNQLKESDILLKKEI